MYWVGVPISLIFELHQLHGDVDRLGLNYLTFADPAALKDIYGRKSRVTKLGYQDKSFIAKIVLMIYSLLFIQFNKQWQVAKGCHLFSQP